MKLTNLNLFSTIFKALINCSIHQINLNKRNANYAINILKKSDFAYDKKYINVLF